MTAWEDAWHTTAETDLTVGLLAELVDMRQRHPWYWDDPDLAPEVGRAGSTFRGMGSDVEQWRPLVEAFFPADQVEKGLCVIRLESGGNRDARNPSSSARGLWQVLGSWASKFGYEPDDLYDPIINTEIAAALYADGGWSHWVVAPRC
jgi:hypothetical protein